MNAEERMSQSQHTPYSVRDQARRDAQHDAQSDKHYNLHFHMLAATLNARLFHGDERRDVSEADRQYMTEYTETYVAGIRP